MEDRLSRLRRVDSSGMYDRMVNFPAQVEDALRRARHFEFPEPGTARNAVVCGMGGSAIGGDLARDYLIDSLMIPMEVNRDYRLPAYAERESLVIISSYSGDTEETVSSMMDAIGRGCAVVAITTGGEVARLAGERGIPLLTIPPGFQPREALAYSFLPIVFILKNYCHNREVEGEADEAIEQLERLSQRACRPVQENEAFALAGELRGRFPVIYCQSRHFASVATRWRSQLAENSEVLSTSHSLPELNHNEIMGWGKEKEILSRAYVIYLKDSRYHERVQLRWKLTRELIGQVAAGLTEVESEGDGLMARMLSLIYKGDFVSLYLSYFYGIDPTPVEKIAFLKKRLSGGC